MLVGYVAPGDVDGIVDYDALHVLISGGDTLIQRNRFADHGDDAINLSTPQSPIASVEEAGARLTLSKYSRFLRPGQAVTLVNPNGQVVGNATVARRCVIPAIQKSRNGLVHALATRHPAAAAQQARHVALGAHAGAGVGVVEHRADIQAIAATLR